MGWHCRQKSGVSAMFSDLLGLTIYVPGPGEAANTGIVAFAALLGALAYVVGGLGYGARPVR